MLSRDARECNDKPGVIIIIRYFVLENKKLEPAKEYNYDKVTWIDVVKPSEAELLDVAMKYKLNLEDLEDCLDETIRPRYTSDFILGNQELVLRISNLMNVDLQKTSTEPLGIIITKDGKLLTVHTTMPSYFNELIDIVQRLQPESSFMVVLNLLHFLIDVMGTSAQKITMRIRDLEKKVLQSHTAKDIHEPFQLNAYFIYFVTSMLGNLNALRSFSHKYTSLKEKDLVAYEKLEDLITDMEQVFTFSSIYRDSLNNILDAYASVINNNLTTVMKIVGSLNLILGVPTLISSFFGQNLFFGLPLPEDRQIWPFILVTMVTVFLSMGLYKRFRKADWI